MSLYFEILGTFFGFIVLGIWLAHVSVYVLGFSVAGRLAKVRASLPSRRHFTFEGEPHRVKEHSLVQV
jgi:hypothetical protein